MKEILPGVTHWTRVHPKIGVEVSSYYLATERTLIDPLIPEEGVESLPAAVRQILLTNRHHYRDSGEIAERFGCPVRCVEQGLHEFDDGCAVEAFRFGDTLPGGIEVVEIGAICPDECALFVPRNDGIVAVADGVVRMGEPLGFVPDEYMGEDPEEVKRALRVSYRRLLERRFEHLLLAHGMPWIGGADRALRDFVGN